MLNDPDMDVRYHALEMALSAYPGLDADAVIDTAAAFEAFMASGAQEKMVWFRQYVLGTGLVKQRQVSASVAQDMIDTGGHHPDQFSDTKFPGVMIDRE